MTTYEYKELLTNDLEASAMEPRGDWKFFHVEWQLDAPQWRIVFRRVSTPPPRDVNLTVLWRMASHARDEAQNYRDAWQATDNPVDEQKARVAMIEAERTRDLSGPMQAASRYVNNPTTANLDALVAAVRAIDTPTEDSHADRD